MLHESVRDQNEVARKPTSDCDRHRRHEVISRPESLFTPDQGADECALQKEREHAFHRQGLSDHAAGILGEGRPVRAKLKLDWYTGDDPHGEIQSEDFGPKPGSLVVLLITRPPGSPFPIH